MAEDQGVVVGLVGAQIQVEDRADLIQLRVKKSHRRKGIATMLIQKVEEYAKSLEKNHIYLHTAERLINARKLYQKLGYKLESSTDTSPPFEFTIMIYKKTLGQMK